MSGSHFSRLERVGFLLPQSHLRKNANTTVSLIKEPAPPQPAQSFTAGRRRENDGLSFRINAKQWNA